jgi:hypothetical protein
MSNVAMMIRSGLAAVLALGLVACFPGESTTPNNNGQSAPTDDVGQSSDTGESTDDTGSADDTGQTSDAGDDANQPEDTGSSDDTGASEDVTEPVDTGNPLQRDCSDGPLDAPIEGCSPQPLPSTGDPREDCVRRINQFRWECQCLPPLERWHEGEDCADEQAAYDEETGQYHAGFREGICSPRGRAQNECPGYGTWDRVIGTCLQQMWDEGPGEPFSEHGHYINMSSERYTKVACGAGDTWFVQNFR